MASVVLSSALGGIGPSIVSITISVFGMSVFLWSQSGDIHFESIEDFTRIFIFLIANLFLATVGSILRNALIEAKAAKIEAEEATRARDEFLSIASHELKTPLSSLMMRIQLGIKNLADDQSDPDKVRAHYEKLLHSGDRSVKKLCRLIDDLLDFSRVVHDQMKMKPELINLRSLVQEIEERFEEELKSKAIPMAVNIPNFIDGFWDPLRIDQVISNLVSNAIKYGNAQPISIDAFINGDHISILVSDHGPGIDEKDLEAIFDRFKRVGSSAAIGGLGLGLYISQRIAKLHSGRIWATSSKDVGTTFHLDLPQNLSF